MARMVRTTRFSGVKDTNTSAFDQNGRRISGNRPTLAAGETVVKRGNVAVPPRVASTTRVSSSTRVTATVTRPGRGAPSRPTPVQERYEEEEEEQDDYEEQRAERMRAVAQEKADRILRKEQETAEFHAKYYALCKDKDKLEAYPGYRFGMQPPDPDDIHALGVYKMNLAECEKQEARQKKKEAAKSAIQEARATVSRTGRPPARTPKTAAPGLRAKTPGRKTEDQLMQELYEKHSDRLNKQTQDFHNKYYPLCRDKKLLEAYPGFRFGMPVPDYDDLLAVNGYMLELRNFEAAEEVAFKSKKKTKAQKEKEERDARIAAKRVSLRPPPRKPRHEPLSSRKPPSRNAPDSDDPYRGPPRVARGPPPWYHGPLTIGPDGQEIFESESESESEPEPEPEPQPRRGTGRETRTALRPGPGPGAGREPKTAPRLGPGTQPEPTESQIKITAKAKVVIEEDMEKRIFELKQKAFERGVYQQPPAPTPAKRAILTPSPERMALRPPQPSGLRAPSGSGIPQQSGLRAPSGSGIPQQSGLRAPSGSGIPQQSGLRAPAGRGIPQRSGLRPPAPRGIPQRAGSQIGRGRPPPAAGGLVAKPVTAVNVLTNQGPGRSIFVPTEVATASHNTVVAVRKGTNVASPVDDQEEYDVDPLNLEGCDDIYNDTLVPAPNPTLDAFEQMRMQEEQEARRLQKEEEEEARRLQAKEELQNKRDAIVKLRQAAAMLNQQRKELNENIRNYEIPVDLENMTHYP